MEKGDIVTVIAMSGEYVGKFVDDRHGLVLENPRMILQNQETGEMGFAQGVAVTGDQNPKEITFDQYIFVTPTNDKVATAWQDATSSIITTKPKLVK
jgi:hypothetical protein|tara:strand:+ start:1247 stop:1537 length:291 start_codon:yes stop_codon:yes gene_type:complete